MLIGTKCKLINNIKVKHKGVDKKLKKGRIFTIKNIELIDEDIFIEFDKIEGLLPISAYYNYFEWKATLQEIFDYGKK
jgi:uncharacterized Zn ribbon protein